MKKVFNKKEYLREYQQRPEIKAKSKEYQREYQQRPEIKAKNKIRGKNKRISKFTAQDILNQFLKDIKENIKENKNI